MQETKAEKKLTRTAQKALIKVMEAECARFKDVPLTAKNPSPETAQLMVRAFMAKKKLQEMRDYGKPKVVEVRKEKVISAWGRRKGRPRTKTTKVVTMVRDGDKYRLAGRGRPKAGQVREKLEVHYKFIVNPKSWYTYSDKSLSEIN